MFDPRQRQMGQPMQRPGWMQQLGQGLAAQQPQWGQPMPQGGPPPGVRFMPGGGGGMPPQAAPGPDGRPMAPPGASFMRDQDAAIRAALARSGGRVPVGPGGVPGPQTSAMPVNAGAPEAMPQGQPGMQEDEPQGDPRMQQRGMGGYR